MRGKSLYVIAFALIGCLANDSVITNAVTPITLDSETWKTEVNEVCMRNPKTGLRVVIFAPIYETKMGSTPIHHAGTELVFIPGVRLPDGSNTRTSVQERVIPNMYHPKTYRSLKQQTVGYLTDNDEWVNEKGEPVFAFNNFYTRQGISGMPFEKVIASIKIETDLQTKQDDYLSIKTRIQTALPCTYIQIPSTYKMLKETVEYRSPNQVLTCGAAGSIEQKPPFTYARDITRRVSMTEKTVLFTDIFGNFGEGISALFQVEKTPHQGQFCDWVHLSRRP